MAPVRVGWVGVGIMGRPMATNLQRAGFEVAAYNRGSARSEAWRAAGGRSSPSPREAAERADVLMTMVSDTADVESVLFGESGAAETLRPAASAGEEDGTQALIRVLEGVSPTWP